LISISGSLIFSCVFNWVLVLLTFVFILRRIKKEEEYLILRYPEYKNYMKKTFRMVPFVF